MIEKKTKKDYLEIPKKDLCGCFNSIDQKWDLYNLTKNEMKRICYGLELAKESKPNDRIINRMLREYKNYLKNYK